MSNQNDKAVECSPKKKNKDTMYYVHTLIAFAITAIFWIIPPIDPIVVVKLFCNTFG